jgi:hypothetical protein
MDKTSAAPAVKGDPIEIVVPPSLLRPENPA